MKIDELVGKSLAAAVATIVMGWEYRRCLDVEWWCDTDGFGRHTTDSFRPDLNIAQAWEVLEKMFQTQPNGHAGPTGLHYLKSCDQGRSWSICFCTDFGYTPEVTADTAPLAICRAALLAKEVLNGK